MATGEWVEVRGPSVEIAVEGALAELGLESADDADVEVIEEGQRGFLGMGGQDALVRVKAKERSRSGRGSRGGSSKKRNDQKEARSNRGDGNENDNRGSNGSRRRNDSRDTNRGGNKGDNRKKERPPRKKRDDDDRIEMSVEAQAGEIDGFLDGLLESFGLEGDVGSRIEDGVIYTEVTGAQTEALVGPKGNIVQATLELCRTIVQRKTASGAKIRLDIAGYAERRREALRIYTNRLAEKVLSEGGEIMLEPMNSADRKVVHDSVADIDGVRSFSEGEEPRRSVVIANEASD